MTAELILGVTATALIIAAVVITYCVAPVRRKPFVVELLNVTFGRGSPRDITDDYPSRPPRRAQADKHTVLPV